MDNKQDLTLQRFGKLVAKWSFHYKGENVWKCNCDCGTICYVKERALTECIITSCGCRKNKKTK